ncbi:MAG: aldolase/citrate lyase family protein, partial [Planctomycetaceae bacterium]
MRQSRTRARLANNEAVRICCLGHFIPAFVRHAADSGFDCIWLDFEHRCWTDREIQAILPLFHLYDIDCLLRVPTTEKTRLYRYLEDGATGLMVPHVSTVEAARELVESVKFPPIGNRGLDAAGLDCDFSLPEHVEYVREANEQTMLVVQIETPEAVENVEAIAALEGVDGLFIGPG